MDIRSVCDPLCMLGEMHGENTKPFTSQLRFRLAPSGPLDQPFLGFLWIDSLVTFLEFLAGASGS